MPSKALTSFEFRLKEIEQLLEAHKLLLQYYKAAAARKNLGWGNLQNALEVFKHLVTAPGPGRPPQVQALNKAAIALLSGHLQGFITDLYSEAASKILTGHVSSLQAVTNTAPTRRNPSSQNIKWLFATLGFKDIFAGISWQKCSNEMLHKRLKDFNELRNKIVHGTSISVTKTTVTSYLSSWTALAQRLDAKLRTEINVLTGKHPW